MKTSILNAMTLAFLTLSVGCPPPTPNPPPQPDFSDAGADIDAASSPATCDGWCKHAVVLKCTAAQPTKAGSSCSEVCANVQSGPVKWNLRCRISAKSCAEADACPPLM